MITYNQKYANPKLAKIKSNTVKLKIPSKMNLTQVYKNLNISKKILKKYNRCINKQGFKRYLYNPLPKDFHIIIPKYLKSSVDQALNKFTRTKFMRKQL